LSRVQRIKNLLQLSTRNENVSSAARWEAAYLIWEELRSGKSQREVGEEIGTSHVHVGRMARCWETVIHGPQIEYDTFEQLGANYDFRQIYQSDDIRGPAARKPEVDNRRRTALEDDDELLTGRSRQPRPDTSDDFSAHGLVTRAASALGMLATHRAYWAMMSEDDWELLSRIRGWVDHIGRGA
jgi:uncharacterized protein YerC